METGLEKGEQSETFAEIPDKDWKPELKGLGFKNKIKFKFKKRDEKQHR